MPSRAKAAPSEFKEPLPLRRRIIQQDSDSDITDPEYDESVVSLVRPSVPSKKSRSSNTLSSQHPAMVNMSTSGKNSGLAVVWLAATLGPRSSCKRLSKRDVNSVNIQAACHYLSSPPEPMALRLSSNFMVGIARILDTQYNFYLHDLNRVFLQLKRALSSIQSGNLNMAIPEARLDAITFMQGELEDEAHLHLMREPSFILDPHGGLSAGQSDYTLNDSLRHFQGSSSASVVSGQHKSASFSGSLVDVLSEHRLLEDVGSLVEQGSISSLDRLALPFTTAPPSLTHASSRSPSLDMFASVHDDHRPMPGFQFDVSNEWALDFNQQEDHGVDTSFSEVPVPDETLLISPSASPQKPEHSVNVVPVTKPVKHVKKRKRMEFIDEQTELSRQEMLDMRESASLDLVTHYRASLIKKQQHRDMAHFLSSLRTCSIRMGAELSDFYASLTAAQDSTLARKKSKTSGNDPLASMRLRKFRQRGRLGGLLPLQPEPLNDDVEMGRLRANSVDSLNRRASTVSPAVWNSRSNLSNRSHLSDVLPVGYDDAEGFPFESSASQSGSRHTSAFHPDSFLQDADFAPMQDVAVPLFEDEHSSMMTFSEPTSSHVDRQVDAFYRYTQNIMETAKTDHLFLFDILGSHSTRQQACRIFTHVLTLVNRGQLVVEQQQAYQDIKLSITEPVI